ncbi:MAG TPA: hypothetical protein VE870_03285, partial [Bacteroidales bacterium]|nr:hypothetical protein [Bacteroidales bacterium]
MKFLLPLLLMLSLPVTGQNWYLKRSIPWNHPEASDTVMTFKDITSFAKSDYENNNSLLPRYFDIVRWQQENPEVKVSFFRAEYQAVMPDAEAEGRFSDLGDSILIDTHISIGSGKPFLQFGLLPFRKNPVTGSVERLISFVLKVESTPLARAQTFRESPKKGAATAVSLLSTGNWYKIRVKETGIYKLTYDQLATIG